MGDSYMGLAESDASSSASLRLRAIRVSRAELYIDKARECKFHLTAKEVCPRTDDSPDFHKTEDVEDLAEEWAHNHNRVWESGVERVARNSTKRS
jgi:anaphase-promoting complex subunit 5